MHTRNIDLNLLRIFGTLWKEHNVSKAAKVLGLSQPAISHALARLRHEFRDDLFVRSGRGVVSTPFAQEIASSIVQILEDVDGVFARNQTLESKHFTGRVTIMGTDLIEFILFPRLLAQLHAQAPLLAVVSRPNAAEFPAKALESGELDLAIAGYFTHIPEGFMQTKISEEGYMTILRKGHPSLEKEWNAKEFSKLSHVMTSPQGDLDGVVDKELAKLKLRRRVVAGLTTFQVLPRLIEGSDLCATLPNSIALDAAQHFNVIARDPPLKLPAIQLRMIWHQRLHRSPVHVWLRTKISEIIRSQITHGQALRR